MHPYANIAFAKLNITVDRDLFIKEYDDVILPASKPFIPITNQWWNMQRLNSLWNVLPEEQFQYYNKYISSGETNIEGHTHQWDMVNLMQVEGDDSDGGGAYWRHRNLENPKILKTQFKNLNIVKWIMDIMPAKVITGIHCVSVEPGGFATIHRDTFWPIGSGSNPGNRNGYFNKGYVVICVNISNGGVPLLWCLDHEQKTPRSADDDCYIISDYFLHAVPLTKSRRRQIRISMIPNENLCELINESTAVIIPDDYKFTS